MSVLDDKRMHRYLLLYFQHTSNYSTFFIHPSFIVLFSTVLWLDHLRLFPAFIYYPWPSISISNWLYPSSTTTGCPLSCLTCFRYSLLVFVLSLPFFFLPFPIIFYHSFSTVFHHPWPSYSLPVMSNWPYPYSSILVHIWLFTAIFCHFQCAFKTQPVFPSFFWIILPHSTILYQFQPFPINLNHLLSFLVVYYHPYSFSTLSNHACVYIHPFYPHFTFLAIFIYLLSYIVCFRPLPTLSTIFNTSDYFGCYQLFSTFLNLPYSFSTIASCPYSYSFSSTTFNHFWPSFITSSTSSRLMTHFQHHFKFRLISTIFSPPQPSLTLFNCFPPSITVFIHVSTISRCSHLYLTVGNQTDLPATS